MIAAKKMEPWPPKPDMKPFDVYGRFVNHNFFNIFVI